MAADVINLPPEPFQIPIQFVHFEWMNFKVAYLENAYQFQMGTIEHNDTRDLFRMDE